mgnify:CR=1 FL=1
MALSHYPFVLFFSPMKQALLALTCLSALGLLACSTVQTTSSGAIGIERKQYMMVSEEEVEKGAIESYQKELAAAEKKKALNVDEQQVTRVRTIANRLIPQTTVFRPDAKNWKWEINVQKTDELNAYCMPGGKIMVYSGIIEKLKLTDDELAAIVGHEIAHALREHTRERVSRAYAEQLGLSVLAVVTGAGNEAMKMASTITQVTFGLPHNREQETESDRIGLELMARAGYNPNAAVTLWQKMKAQGGSRSPEFLSTHPDSNNRISDLQANLPKVMSLYEGAKQ